jgi:3-mercaptopyruvate sulfurtransferase SseA
MRGRHGRSRRVAASVFLTALLLISSGSVAAGQDDLAAPALRIEWSEFKKLYDAGKVEVIDVRGDDAYAAGHIPGARSIPLDAVESRAGELKKLGKEIVLYCA